MMRKSWIGLGFACWTWAATAQNPMTTGPITWSVDSAGTLSTRQWPVERLMKLKMESPKERVIGNDPFKQPAEDLPELKFQSDRSVSMIGVLDGAGGRVTLTAQRSLVFDAQRRAIRVLDVVSSSEGADREVAISYETAWRQDAGTQVATPREFFVGKSASSSGALAAVIGNTEAPILMIIFGGQEEGWTRKVEASASGLRWTYSGLLGAKQRVVLLHWVGLTDDAQTETVKRTRESLVDQRGMPVEARVDEQVLKELVNFPMAGEKVEDAPNQPGELPLVKQLAESLKIEREFTADHATMAGVPLLKGEFTAKEIALETDGGKRDLALEEIAALQGGAGIGRRARVFLRDGTVVSGVLQWKEGAIQTEGLGTVRVTPEAVDALVLRKDEDKDGRSAFAAMVMTQSGEVRALAEIPQGMARLRWPGGGLQLPWEEIESVRQLPLPDLGQEAWLKDGSRIRGWFGSDDPALADCAVYARTWTALQQGLEAAKGSGSSNDPAPKEPHLRTHHDSLIVGRWGQPVVAVSAAAGPIEVPVEEIRKLRVQSGEGDQDQILLEIATAAGGVVKGAAVTDAVRWNHGEQMLSLPWSSVAEIVQTPNVPISK